MKNNIWLECSSCDNNRYESWVCLICAIFLAILQVMLIACVVYEIYLWTYS